MAEYFPIDVYKSYSGSFSGSFYGDGSGITGVKAFPAGPNKSVQFNDNKVSSGSGNFTFDKNANALTLTGSLNITGSTTQVGNNTLLGNTTLSGSIIISGALGQPNPTISIFGDLNQTGYTRYLPVTTNLDTSLSASYIYVSGSTQDLYFSQNGNGYANTTRLRWLEGNLYTGLLHGGLITATTGSTTFNISSGSGIIVTLNASINDDPYPTIQFVNWGNFVNQTITYRTSSIQTFLGIDSNGQIIQQVIPWNDGQYNTSISLGTVLHQNQSTVNATITYPNVAYGYKQRTYDFIKAFGPLKLSGYALNTSSSLGLTVGSGTAFADGRNYQVDPNNPSYITDAGTTVSKIFRYYQSGSSFVQDTNAGLGYTGIDTTQYNPNGNGVLTSVSPSKFYVHRIFYYPNSATKGIVDYYGLGEYSTLDEAQSNYTNEPFIETPNTQQNAIFLGIIIIKGNSNFTNVNNYRLVQSSLFRAAGTGGGGGGGGATTSPGGSTTQIQYNDGGLFNGSPNFTFSGSNHVGITGSLIVSGIYGGINTLSNKPNLFDLNGITRVQWGDGNLNSSANDTTLNWEDKLLYDSTTATSIDWENRTLSESTNTWVALDYSNDTYINSQLYYRNIIPAQVQRTVSNSPISSYGGQIIQATIDAGVIDFQLVYLETDGIWYPTKAGVIYGATKMLGICVDQAGGYVLIEGDIGVSDDDSQGAYVIGADHGLPVYVSNSTGVMTTTSPSGTGEVVRIVGHIYYQSSTDTNWWTMKFRPSNDWYVL